MRIDRSGRASLARHSALLHALLLMVGLLIVAATARAQSSWTVAQRDDEAIISFVGKLTPYAADAPGAADAAAVILYKQNFFEVEEKSHQECRNLVVMVNDPALFSKRRPLSWKPLTSESEKSNVPVRLA